MTNAKYLIVKASGGGGLGDCIKSLLVAVLYAKHTGRIMVVDWTGGVYAETDIDPYSLFFSIRGVPEVKQIPQSDDVYPVRWRGRLHQSLHEVYTQDDWLSWDRATTIKEYSADLSKLDYAEQVLVVWDFDQLAKLMEALSLPYQSALLQYQELANHHLCLSSAMEHSLQDALDAIQMPELGVHIRATKEFQDNKGSIGLAHYIATVEAAGFAGKAIFLATDNAKVEEEFRSRFASTQTLSKWFSRPGESLHLNDDCPDKIDGLRAAILDILLLSRCPNLLITPNSSFSELAQIMSPISQRVFGPKNSGIWSEKWQQFKSVYRNQFKK